MVSSICDEHKLVGSSLASVMSCGPGGQPPGLVVVACVRAPEPGSPLSQMVLFKKLLPSFRRTVSQAELRSLQGPACLYLCAEERDELFIERVRELSYETKKRTQLGFRLFFYPTRSAGTSPFRETAAQAYADGAQYLHHTFDDVIYLEPGWLGGAIRSLQQRTPTDVGVVLPSLIPREVSAQAGVARVLGRATARPHSSTRVPTTVSRRHLDIFAEYSPVDLPEHAASEWLASVYAPLAGGTLPAASRLQAAWVSAAASNHSALRRRTSHTVARAPPTRYDLLVECGQAAVARQLRMPTPAEAPPADCNAALRLLTQGTDGDGVLANLTRSLGGHQRGGSRPHNARAARVPRPGSRGRE